MKTPLLFLDRVGQDGILPGAFHFFLATARGESVLGSRDCLDHPPSLPIEDAPDTTVNDPRPSHLLTFSPSHHLVTKPFVPSNHPNGIHHHVGRY